MDEPGQMSKLLLVPWRVRATSDVPRICRNRRGMPGRVPITSIERRYQRCGKREVRSLLACHGTRELPRSLPLLLIQQEQLLRDQRWEQEQRHAPRRNDAVRKYEHRRDRHVSGTATNTGLARPASSRRSGHAVCQARIQGPSSQHALPPSPRPRLPPPSQMRETRKDRSNAAVTPAEAAASARVDVHVSQRPYGGRRVGRRLAALTQIAASGPYR